MTQNIHEQCNSEITVGHFSIDTKDIFEKKTVAHAIFKYIFEMDIIMEK